MQLVQQVQRVTHCAATILLVVSAIKVQAAPSTFALEWEEIGVDGDGTASAVLTLEENQINNPGFSDNITEAEAFVNFDMWIGGNSDYAGAFYTTEDFDFIYLNLTKSVDLSIELISQPGFDDFNVLEFSGSGPSSILPNKFELFDEIYGLVSFERVPEPNSIWLMIVALAGFNAVTIRRNSIP